MTNWEIATKENINKLVFKPNDIDVLSSHRLSTSEKNKLKERHISIEKKLPITMLKYAHETVGNKASNFAVYIGVLCNQSDSQIRKIFNGKRPVTKEFLGRFCVGLKLSMEKSEELFVMLGEPLIFEKSYFDAVTMTAIKDGDSIDTYEEDLLYYSN